MKIKKLIKNNLKFYLILAVIIIIGTIGVTFALSIGSFNAIAINTTASEIDAEITYDTGYSANITNTGNLLPISDSLVTDSNVTDTRVLKVKFNVSGIDTNPENTIYDIALYANNIDCELRNEQVKWRLYRSDTLISEGNLSPTFDTMANNRLVLTNTQEDLSTTAKDYTFLLWISESCPGNVTDCDSDLDQSKYLNKNLSGVIKVELSTNSKKELTRITGSELSCDYTEVVVPVCNSLTYNGEEQELVSTSSSTLVSSNNYTYKVLPLGVTPIAETSTYTINNNIGINAGKYPVILSLEDGYKWTDGSTDDKCIYCSINKKDVTITTLNQTVSYGTDISNSISNVNVSGLIDGHTMSSVSLNESIYDVGTGTISSSNAKIVDVSGNDVTSNYNINYNNAGTVTINCIKSSVVPTVTDQIYTGETKIGVTGGSYVSIDGVKSAIASGKYSVTVTPIKNYCWSDGTNTTKTLSWSINKVYTITYDANGGTGAPESQTKVHGNTLTLSSTVPTRDGYNFLGWSTRSNATSATYEAGDGYTSNAAVTLYAVWKEKQITLIQHIKNLYTNANPTLITQSTSNVSYYYSYQDSGKTWGLMNDGLKVSSTEGAGATVIFDTTALISGTEGNIRYFGPSDSVNNYIYFNCSDYSDTSTCEKWRIIGIVDGKVKIIRNESIGSLAWDQDKNQDSSLTSYSNNWETSSLQLFLNGLYYNRGTTTSHTYYSGSNGSTATTLDLTTIGITEATRTNNLISETTWYLGGYSSFDVYPNDIYGYERKKEEETTIASGNPYTLEANIGLMYASDYGYATDLTKCSYTIISYANHANSSACRTNNWLFNSAYQWLITPSSSNATYAWLVDYEGYVNWINVWFRGDVDSDMGVSPVLYLNSELTIESEGEGTSTSPYRISIS